MKTTFTLNKKKYEAIPFDFNLMCDLEDMGTPVQNSADKPTSLLRSYFSLCSGLDKELAGKEIELHMISGGSLDELSDAFGKMLDESDFFRALSQTEETEITENESKKK